MFNPFAGYRVSQGWNANHRAVDYATPIGFEFGSPGAGIYHHLAPNLSRTDPNAPGVWGQLTLDDGDRIRFCHLDGHIARSGSRVEMGTPLAVTGNSGYVIPRPTLLNPRAGAHMHTYGLTESGLRWNWTLYATVAGLVTKPFAPAVPEPQFEKRKLAMHECLIVYKETNDLLIVNLKDKTIINLGNDTKSGLRKYYANNFKWSTVSEPEWTKRFGNYKYI